MANNSFATFFGATYPSPTDVLNTAPTYGDSQNVLNGTFDPGGSSPNYPLESQVLLGIPFGTLGSEEFLGNYRPNIPGDVRDGKVFGSLDSEQGILDLPSINDVEDGVFFDNNTKEGNFVAPATGDVRESVGYGSLGTEFTGTLVVGACDYPAITDVRSGVSFDSGGQTGTLDLPNVSDVRLNVQFDGNLQTGTLNIDTEANLPLTGQVLQEITYGSQLQFTGTLDPGAGGTVPAASDVRFGVPTGSTVGNLILPTEAQVLISVGYGSEGLEFTGTLAETPGGIGQLLPPVLTSGQLRSPLFIGDSYLAANENAFQWTIAPPAGLTTGAIVRFTGRPICDNDCSEGNAWDVTGMASVSGEDWLLSVDMTTAQTSPIPAGDYAWTVTLEQSGAAITLENGFVTWQCR